jgi:hypothetical protein
MKCKKTNLPRVKKKLLNTYKKGRDETPILERLEDKFHVNLTKDYGNDSPKQVNSLFKRLKRLQDKGYEC